VADAMRPAPPSWVDPLMRIGYAARGVVYLLVGALAFIASVDGGSTPNSKSALGSLLGQPFGKAMLAIIAIGLVAYALWSFIDAAMDLDDKGSELKGMAGRAAVAISGAIHLALALSVAPLALGVGSRQGNGDTDHWTAVLMGQPFGRWLVATVGIVAIAIGVQHLVKAYRSGYRHHLRYTRAAARLDPLLKMGLAAHGVVVVIVGGFFILAAWTNDPSRAGGVREALSMVRSSDAGDILLAIAGIGLVGFAVYCFIVAAFRIVPRCSSPDLQTLASKARELLA
jgi:hypothetical protein